MGFINAGRGRVYLNRRYHIDPTDGVGPCVDYDCPGEHYFVPRPIEFKRIEFNFNPEPPPPE